MAPLPNSDRTPFLPHIITLAATWGLCPPQPVSRIRHARSPSPLPPTGSGYNARRAFSAALFKTDLLWLTTSANCCSTSGGAPGPSCCITLISSLAKRVLCAKSVAAVANRWTSCCLAVSPQVKHNNSCSRGICQSCSFSGSCLRKLLQHYILSFKMATLPLLMVRLNCTS